MNLYLIFQFFLLGLTISLSFCWTLCTPIFFIATSISEIKFKNFVNTVLKYLITKFITQILFTLLIYLILDKMLITKTIVQFSPVTNLFFGITFLYFGVLKIYEIAKNDTPQYQNNKLLRNIFPTLTGFFSGLNLCLPKIFIYGYLFTKSNNLLEVLLYIISFTIGEIFSPIIIMSVLINFLKSKLVNLYLNIKKFFIYAGATILIIFGLVNTFFIISKSFNK